MRKDQNSKPTKEQIDALKPQPVEGLNSFDIKGLVNYINTKHPNKIQAHPCTLSTSYFRQT